MKATLEFDLPEENGELKSALEGSKWESVLWHLDQSLRSTVKHGDDPKKAEWAEQIRKEILEGMDGHGLTWSE